MLAEIISHTLSNLIGMMPVFVAVVRNIKAVACEKGELMLGRDIRGVAGEGVRAEEQSVGGLSTRILLGGVDWIGLPAIISASGDEHRG